MPSYHKSRTCDFYYINIKPVCMCLQQCYCDKRYLQAIILLILKGVIKITGTFFKSLTRNMILRTIFVMLIILKSRLNRFKRKVDTLHLTRNEIWNYSNFEVIILYHLYRISARAIRTFKRYACTVTKNIFSSSATSRVQRSKMSATIVRKLFYKTIAFEKKNHS